MPDTPADTAKQIIETIRAAVENLKVLPVSDGSIKKVTLSLGIATMPQHTTIAAELQKLADTALYQAKESGRNKVAILDESGK